MKNIFLLSACLFTVFAYGQFAIDINPFDKKKTGSTLYQRNHGAIIGLQKGAGTAIEMGYEAHWRKVSLFKPHIIGATTNMEYDMANHIMGYRAGMWMKRGRVNLTYGGNLLYFTNFEGGHRYGIGPSVGFRLAGFHLMNGINVLGGNTEVKANTLFVSLRYYFPVRNKFTWDRSKDKNQSRSKGVQGDEEKKGLRRWL